ncbi:MAG: FCSD flavin-binding domain-containing protein [Pseudomonadales bacterium]
MQMGNQTRRQFVRRAAAAAALGLATAACTGAPMLSRSKPRIVVVGGGVGGTSVVRRLAADHPGALDIVLLEPDRTYTTCFYSNLFVGDLRELEVLQFDYGRVAALPGVRVVHERAAAIDVAARQVLLGDGTAFPYDRLVLSPGIDLDYDSVPGWSREAARIMPHAWRAGPQTALLKRQLDAVPDGGLIVMLAPPNPYRCPPGPYERVSMMARALTESGRTQTRIVIVDPKRNFSKQPLFQQGWERHYPGMIEWLSPMIHGGVQQVDPATMTVETGFETYRNADLVNVIPRQTAGAIAVAAGLTGEDDYCPIDPATMHSTLDPYVFVLGDSCIAGDMPKSAFSAHSQAQVVAAGIAHELLDAAPVRATYRNRCWSLIADADSVFVGGWYQPADGRISQTESEISALEDSGAQRQTNYADSAAWYLGLTSELYG